MPTVNELVAGWRSHFFSADRDIQWLHAEVEHSVWLSENTVLMGRLDALGRNAEGKLFFGEWKTSNGRDRKTWKATWRMNPQSLTYGMLAGAFLGEPCNRFTVRKAFKTDPPTFDHAWYSYSDAELAHWRRELLGAAHEMREYMKDGALPWPTNFSHCFAYGEKYACPFFEVACGKLDWNARPAESFIRVSHLESERSLAASDGVIVLDATRIKTWFECRERFRREYIENVDEKPGEALQFGIDFHNSLGIHYQERIDALQTPR